MINVYNAKYTFYAVRVSPFLKTGKWHIDVRTGKPLYNIKGNVINCAYGCIKAKQGYPRDITFEKNNLGYKGTWQPPPRVTGWAMLQFLRFEKYLQQMLRMIPHVHKHKSNIVNNNTPLCDTTVSRVHCSSAYTARVQVNRVQGWSLCVRDCCNVLHSSVNTVKSKG